MAQSSGWFSGCIRQARFQGSCFILLSVCQVQPVRSFVRLLLQKLCTSNYTSVAPVVGKGLCPHRKCLFCAFPLSSSCPTESSVDTSLFATADRIGHLMPSKPGIVWVSCWLVCPLSKKYIRPLLTPNSSVQFVFKSVLGASCCHGGKSA